MLAKAPGTAVVPASGVPIFSLRAVAADQVQNGAGLLIIWTIAPSTQFVHQGSAARLKSARLAEADLTGCSVAQGAFTWPPCRPTVCRCKVPVTFPLGGGWKYGASAPPVR